MLPAKSGDTYGTTQLAERQMLLRNARDRALHESPTAKANRLNYRFMTISRMRGSLGDAMARDLAERLGWQVFDKEIVDHIARHSHVRQSLVEQLDERAQNLIQESVQRFLTLAAGASFGAEEYREALLKTIAVLAARGDAILVGRGANFALREERGGLHVRIIASHEVRARRLMERWGISLSSARQRMEQMDLERRSFVKHLFKQDIDDPHPYDLVFNTDNLTARQVADSIVVTLGGAIQHGDSVENQVEAANPQDSRGLPLEAP